MFFLALTGTTIGLSALCYFLLLKVNNSIWKKGIIRYGAWLLLLMSVFFSVFWGFGKITNISSVSFYGAAATGLSLVLNVLLLLSLLFSFWIVYFRKKREKSKSQNINVSRRSFLKATTASFPAFAIAGTATGLASSFSPIRFPQIEVAYPDLPDALNGFKILQLSDLHLGYFFLLNDLEYTLRDAEKYNVDMVVVTGDIADNIWDMTDTTRLIGQLKAPFGKFISVGNHEYYRSIRRSIIYIERGPIPLLYSSHHVIDVKGIKMLIGGADDPVYAKRNQLGFLDNSIKKTFKDAPDVDFKLLMSHRPRALDLAPKYGIDLILAGHTHGGQIGWGGKSFWEIFNENGYLWGLYEKQNSKLYTTAGMGHWFPFRLNCPPEAPVITLRKSKQTKA